MTAKTIERILVDHSIEYTIENGHIIANGYYTKDGKTGCDKVDVTEYTKTQLYDWLGYQKERQTP